VLSSRASRRRGVTYAVLVATSLVLLAVSNTGPVRELQRGVGFALTPIQTGLAGFTRNVTSVFSTIAEIDRLRQDNRLLEQRNQELEVENRGVENIKLQNEMLTHVVGVKSSLSFDTVVAEVISRQVTQYERVVSVNQGTDAGISTGDVVLAGGAAVVGRVVDAGPNYSRVLLITDTRSTVIGLIESSRATGDVQGQLGGALVMTKIPSTDEVALEDTVVTAGIDLGNGIRSPFPKGLLIGRVVDVQRDPNAVVQTAFVEPAAPPDKLEYVLVITDYEGGDPIVGPSGSPTPAPSGGASESPSASSTDPVIELPSPSIVLSP